MTSSYYKELESFLLHNIEVDLSTVLSVLPRNYQLTNTALEIFIQDGHSFYLDFESNEDRLGFFTCIQQCIPPSLQKYTSYCILSITHSIEVCYSNDWFLLLNLCRNYP